MSPRYNFISKKSYIDLVTLQLLQIGIRGINLSSFNLWSKSKNFILIYFLFSIIHSNINNFCPSTTQRRSLFQAIDVGFSKSLVASKSHRLNVRLSSNKRIAGWDSSVTMTVSSVGPNVSPAV